MLVIVGGPSGCGKSTLARHLAAKLDAEFLEGDDLYSAANVDKMSRGIPLTDEDRFDWLREIALQGSALVHKRGIAVATCSSLKKIYRDLLRTTADVDILFVILNI